MQPRTLKEVLTEENITASEFAQKTGLSRGTVYRAMKQERLSFDSVHRIIGALRLGMNDILWGRNPLGNTKPVGSTGSKQRTIGQQQRLCDVHKQYYPSVLEVCPLCE